MLYLDNDRVHVSGDGAAGEGSTRDDAGKLHAECLGRVCLIQRVAQKASFTKEGTKRYLIGDASISRLE
jgi:hypothetical protein